MKYGHGGNVFKFAQLHQIAVEDVIDYSANINPLGPSESSMGVVAEMLPMVSHYPDPNQTELLDAIERVYKMPKEHIVAGNGAAELLYAICRLPGYTGCFVPAPGFSEYRLAAETANIPVRDTFYMPRESAEGDHYFEVPYLALQTFAAKLKGQDGRIICFLGNPNNPDGTLLEREHVRVLAGMLRDANSLLVIDESFIDFVGTEPLGDNPHSLRDLIFEFDNVVVVHSLTKFYAVPGLRVGVLFAPKILQPKLKELIPTWSVNTLAQAYATLSVDDTEYVEKTKAVVCDEKSYMYTALSAIPALTVYKPSVNFMLLKINTPNKTVEQLQEYLGDSNIFIRSCANYEGLDEQWFRVAIKTRESNEILVKKLQLFFS